MSELVSRIWQNLINYMGIALLAMIISAIIFYFFGLALEYGGYQFFIGRSAQKALVIFAGFIYLSKWFFAKKLALRYQTGTAQFIDLILEALALAILIFVVFFSGN